ncbi:MAG TPA: hypothetical protein VH857_09085 [Actinomycetes bacterium]|jgi:hypothetical protein|nr:hypothetical protein [Actinomycetes bacterium]
MSERPEAVAAATMARALRDRDADQPVDVAAGRRTLAARSASARGWRQPRRTLLVVAAVTVVVLAVAALLVGAATRRDGDVPAERLPSGLPIGQFTGSFTDRHDGFPYGARMSLLVRSDGTGVLGVMQATLLAPFDVQVRGRHPGLASFYSDSPLCLPRPELSLRFRVGPGGKTVTVLHAIPHGCSVRERVAAELDGIVLHRVARPAP